MSYYKKRGELSEAKVLARLLELNFQVLLPWEDSSPYDVVYVKDDKFVRAQIKTGLLKNNAIRFKTHIWNPFKKKKSTYIGKVDEFLVYSPDTDLVYRIPIEECGTNQGFLRLTETRNNQKMKIKLSKDYTI